MLILSKLIYRFNEILIKISAGFLVEIDKLILKCMWKYNGIKIAEAILKRMKKAGNLSPLDLL